MASTFDTQKWMQVQSHAVRVSKLTNETTASSKCILQKSNMAMENYPFGCFPRSPSFAEFLAGHDYRSIATGHQAHPFSRAAMIFTAVSHPWRVRSMPKRGYSNAKKTTVTTAPGNMRQPRWKLPEYIVSLESNIKPDIYSPLGCCKLGGCTILVSNDITMS